MVNLAVQVQRQIESGPADMHHLHLYTADGRYHMGIARPTAECSDYLSGVVSIGPESQNPRQAAEYLREFLRHSEIGSIQGSRLCGELGNHQHMRVQCTAVPELEVRLYEIDLWSNSPKPRSTRSTGVFAKLVQQVYGLRVIGTRYEEDCSPSPFQWHRNAREGIIIEVRSRPEMHEEPAPPELREYGIKAMRTQYRTSATLVQEGEPLTSAPFLMFLAALPREIRELDLELIAAQGMNRFSGKCEVADSGISPIAKIDFRGASIDALVPLLNTLWDVHRKLSGKRRLRLNAEWQ